MPPPPEAPTLAGEPPAALALRVLGHAVAAIEGRERAGQQCMCAAAAEAMDGGAVLLAQAGTGTGKSLAYLAAGMGAAVGTGRRLVVSTATLALQRQIVLKDGPLVATAVGACVGREPRIALLKGWHNYICRYKLAGGYPADDDPALFALDATSTAAPEPPRGALGEQILRVRRWAEETTSGDRDDLSPGVSDRAWRQVSVTRLECLGVACPLHDDCLPEQARSRAREADVVVTNHALLGIAATGSPGVLPEHGLLVIDEAHDLVARVTSAATVELSAAAIERCSRLAARHAKAAVEPLQHAAASLRSALDELPDGRVRTLRPALHDATVVVHAAAKEALSSLAGRTVEADGGRAVLKAQLLLLTEIGDRLLSDGLTTLRDVAWVSRGRDAAQAPRLHLAPLTVDAAIAANLLDGRAVVATSATLTVGGSFEPMARSFGLADGDSYAAEDYGSPFDHGRQGILYVASHLPRPGRDGISDAALQELTELVVAARGGTLGLFSSMRAAVRAAEHLRERLDTPVLCQGEDQLPALVAAFARDPSASLLGTLSLWQGVDVPGATCRLVVIDRIPFPRPDDPLASARAERAEVNGGSGFVEVSVAHAALLLAQGAGRLIRSSEDRGVVAILDSRLATAGYARVLLRSLPAFWPTRDGALVRGSLARLSL